MKMYLGALYVAIALLLCISSAMAQTVTVDAANGSPNNTDTFNSIQMAIHSFQASGAVAASTDGSGVGVNHGNAAADVINILTSAVPDAIFSIKMSERTINWVNDSFNQRFQIFGTI